MNLEDKGTIVGIDLGTTNSCIAVVNRQGEKFVIANEEGGRTTPSVVFYGDEGSGAGKRFEVGDSAKRLSESNSEDVIFSVKRKMGKKGEESRIKLSGEIFTPTEISTRILSYLVRCAEESLGEKITRVVITIPAKFDEDQRNATEEAGKAAGLKVERLVVEPTAASLAYGLDKSEDEQKILVYDLGGGTFDASVIKIEKLGKDKETRDSFSRFTVLFSSGDDSLGGDDFDNIIVSMAVEDYNREHKIDLSTFYDGIGGLSKDAMFRKLKSAAQVTKHDLTRRDYAFFSVPSLANYKGNIISLNVKILRSVFEKKTAHLMSTTEKCIDEALNKAKGGKLSVGDIDQVVLVGGSTRMPMVENLIVKKFGKVKINKTVNPDEVVAIGAAIQGSILAGHTKGVVLLETTSLSLGIEVVNGQNDVVIPRGTTIPCEKTKIYTTSEDNQTSVSISITQGERARADDNKRLGTFNLLGIRPAPRFKPQIEVTFALNASGLLSVSAKDKDTGTKNEIKIEGSNKLTREEIEEAIRKESEFREKDEEYRENMNLLSSREAIASSWKENLDKIDEWVKDDSIKLDNSDDRVKKLHDMYNNLKVLLDAPEKDFDKLRKQENEISEWSKIFFGLEKEVNDASSRKIEDSPNGDSSSLEEDIEATKVDPDAVEEVNSEDSNIS